LDYLDHLVFALFSLQRRWFSKWNSDSYHICVNYLHSLQYPAQVKVKLAYPNRVGGICYSSCLVPQCPQRTSSHSSYFRSYTKFFRSSAWPYTARIPERNFFLL